MAHIIKITEYNIERLICVIERKVLYNNDILMSNTKKCDIYGWKGNEDVEEAHTHITHWRFKNTKKVADQIERNVIKQVIPKMNKFVKQEVRTVNFDYYIESHLRLALNNTYRNRLINYIKTRENNKQDYVNIQKGARG